MGLSLTAEQKSILKIFRIEEQYVIPAYQRAYSWEYDECFQLYSDIVEALNENEDYFIGNIIIARNEANKDFLEVIDGQQRLVTLLLLIKVIVSLRPDFKILNQLLEKENWLGSEAIPRIKSEIFEAKDDYELNQILKYNKAEFALRLDVCLNKKNNKIIEKNCKSQFEINSLYFYNWLSFYIEQNGDLNSFIKFLLENVYLLPIELIGKNREEANEKALTIFETINNRGLNLSDSDIFKAKLYKRAKAINEENFFIEQWIEFKANCDYIKVEIDDIFRYYSHIIRGNVGITSNEINQRQFFTMQSYSPFELKQYKLILDDLFKILDILNFLERERSKESELAKWLQIIQLYTNQYPKYAIVTYLFINGMSIDNNLIQFIISLTRFIYLQGSTTTIKFEIYSIIKQTCSGEKISDYYTDSLLSFPSHLLNGRLRNGFVLLAFYLDNNNCISNYYIDRIINEHDRNISQSDLKTVESDLKTQISDFKTQISDLETLDSDLKIQILYLTALSSFGNYIVTDMPRKNISLIKKKEYYLTSKLEYVRNLLIKDFSFESVIKREQHILSLLIKFFTGKS